MRRAAGLATVAACVLGLSGCGAEDTARSVKEAVDPVAEAADRTAAAGGARIDGEMVFRAPDGFELPMTLDGTVDFEKHIGRFTVDFDAIPGLTSAENADLRDEGKLPLELIQTPERLYVSDASIRQKGAEAGKGWAMIDLEELDEEAELDLTRASQFSEANPEAYLRFLSATGDARKTGTRTIRGERTTRYTATMNVRRYPEMVPPDERETARRTADLMAKQWGSPTQQVDVWIGEDGLIHRERMPLSVKSGGETFKGTLVLDFRDVGKPVGVAVPDDDEVVDITDQATEQLGG